VYGSDACGRVNRDKTHCPDGHPYAGRNLLVNCHGWRECRKCRTRRQAEFLVRKWSDLMAAMDEPPTRRGPPVSTD